MNTQEFKIFIKRMGPLLEDETINAASYKLSILKEPPPEHLDEDRLLDVFPELTATLLIEQGTEIINTDPGESFIIGRDPVEFSDYRDHYMEIFLAWEKNDWINIIRKPDGNIEASIK